MKFKNDEMAKKWQKFVEVNSKDGYSKGVVTYATRWAELMEETMVKYNASVKDIASRTSHEADTEGITGFMYGMAINALAEMWLHGEQLQQWHNKEYGYEGDGTV